ncbi:DNA replication complex GINS protein psf2 [Histoplasma capsulatum var. duboisii H88]|uniref:DNA replication complex GINS protein PSF2 n=2 Tax=Ajellomyces capsulatus TaxID=5037 RepID=F0UD86_AJEC8|nr:DNA replication complex GINS protein psf2 [Histoplasma capsulatum var. duboisii H88]QSS48874.1 DNA replication complex GINS protein psf2 [Histoplasma capsulatum var. duboisii H88]
MAFPLPRGITPPEIAFLCEMEMVTVIPRQRLEGLELLGGTVPPLLPPRRTNLPLWLALLLKRQRRANILPPPWLNPEALTLILEVETDRDSLGDAFSPPPPLISDNLNGRDNGTANRNNGPPAPGYTLDGQLYYPTPPFILQNTAEDSMTAPSLPYHWLELSTMLLDVASDDLVDADQIRRLIKDLREVRLAKMRIQVKGLDATAVGGGDGLPLTGVGAMEIGESRGFMSGVAETFRQIGASKEEASKERDAEEAANTQYDETNDDYDDMEL